LYVLRAAPDPVRPCGQHTRLTHLYRNEETTGCNANPAVLGFTKLFMTSHLLWHFVAHLHSSCKSKCLHHRALLKGRTRGQGTTTYLTCFYSPCQHKPGTGFVKSVRNPAGARTLHQRVTGTATPTWIRTQTWVLPAAGYLNGTRDSFYSHNWLKHCNHTMSQLQISCIPSRVSPP